MNHSFSHLSRLLLVFIAAITAQTLRAADLISPFRKNRAPTDIVVDYEKQNAAASNIFKAVIVVTDEAAGNVILITNFFSPFPLQGKATSAVELVSFWDKPNIVGAANAFRKRGFRAANVQEMLTLAECVSPDQLPIATASFHTVEGETFLLCLGYRESEKKITPEVKIFSPTDWTLIRMSQWAFVKTERAEGELTQVIEIDKDGDVVGEWRGLELTMFGQIPTDEALLFRSVEPRIQNYLNSINGQALAHKYKDVPLGVRREKGNKIVLFPK